MIECENMEGTRGDISPCVAEGWFILLTTISVRKRGDLKYRMNR